MLTEVVSRAEFDQARQVSSPQKAFLMKHSNACGISLDVLEDFTRFEAHHNEAPCFLLTIQQYRDISALIAKETGVRHESPQVLVFQDGNVVDNYSHYSITYDRLVSGLNQ
jgi:bacillithiol system protein YtxJ|tara:strand:- start:498 stop:830 length:333 start_codon:yes stop_codon:yes gene_type:complete